MSSQSPWTNFIHDQFHTQLMRPQLRKFSRTDWRHMSGHPMLPMEVVHAHPEYAWDWTQMSRQPFEKIQDLLVRFSQKDWDWTFLSSNAPVSFIRTYPCMPWVLSASVPREKFVSTYLTMDDIMRANRDRQGMLRFARFESHHLNKYCLTPRQYHYLSSNPHHQVSILLQHSDKPWDWKELARNHAFPPDKMMPHRHQFPRWRWDHSLTHARLNWLSYQQVRRYVRIPNHFRFFIKNHFDMTLSLCAYYRIVVDRFLRVWIFRRRVLSRAYILSLLSEHLQQDVLMRILRLL